MVYQQNRDLKSALTFVQQAIPESFDLQLLSPRETIYDGLVKAIESVNESGPFSILSGHLNFISLIHDYLTIYFPDNTTQQFAIRRGVVRSYQNRVNVFIEPEAAEEKVGI